MMKSQSEAEGLNASGTILGEYILQSLRSKNLMSTGLLASLGSLVSLRPVDLLGPLGILEPMDISWVSPSDMLYPGGLGTLHHLEYLQNASGAGSLIVSVPAPGFLLPGVISLSNGCLAAS